MPKIYLETNRIKAYQFQFLNSVSIGFDSFEIDYLHEEIKNDRLQAAIINVGLSCKLIADNYKDYQVKSIILKTDKDGLDIKAGGEHNILYDLLFPINDMTARKNQSLYAEYVKYLKRIKELIILNKISISLSDD